MLDIQHHLVEGIVILLASRKEIVCGFYLALYVLYLSSYLWYTYLSVIAVLDHQLFLIVVVLNCMDDLPKENP